MHDFGQRQVEDFRLCGDEESQHNGAEANDAPNADAAIKKQFPENRGRNDGARYQNGLKD